MKWVGACNRQREIRSAYTVGKPEVTRPLGRLRDK
jgi:hypothetical protein